jgi:hypothetical protein
MTREDQRGEWLTRPREANDSRGPERRMAHGDQKGEWLARGDRSLEWLRVSPAAYSGSWTGLSNGLGTDGSRSPRRRTVPLHHIAPFYGAVAHGPVSPAASVWETTATPRLYLMLASRSMRGDHILRCSGAWTGLSDGVGLRNHGYRRRNLRLRRR